MGPSRKSGPPRRRAPPREERPSPRRAAPFQRFPGRYVPGPVAFMRLQPSSGAPPPPIGEGRSRPDLSTPDECGYPGAIPLFRGVRPNIHHDDARRHLPLTVVPLSPCHPLCNHDPDPFHLLVRRDAGSTKTSSTRNSDTFPPPPSRWPSAGFPGGAFPSHLKAGAVPDPYLLSISLSHKHLGGKHLRFHRRVRVL
jgi:hypothetical protein